MATDNTQNRSWFARHKILTGIGGIFLFFILVSALGGPKDGQEATATNTEVSETEEPAAVISASQLYSDYKQNEIAADQKYKNKVIEVSGRLSTIEEMFGRMFVTLETGDIIGKIQCFLDDSETDKAATLTVGQQITLTGKGDGMSLNVAVKNCVIK